MNWIKLSAAMTAFAAHFLTSSSIAEAKPQSLLNQLPYESIVTQTISLSRGKTPTRTSAGRRGCSESKAMANQNVYALIPTGGETFTAEATPTLWFYIPYTSTSSVPVRLTLQSEKGETVYDPKTITLLSTPGIVGVQLPHPLKPGIAYHWYLTVMCDGKNDSATVDGWIQRSQFNPDIMAQINNSSLPLKQRLDFYKRNNLWQDRLTLLATQVNKNDQAKLEWNALLKEIQFEELQSEPVLGFHIVQ